MSFILNFHARNDFQVNTTVVHDLWVLLPIATKNIAGCVIIKINNEQRQTT